MMDSPVGIAVWINENFQAWSYTNGANIESVHTKDEMLTNIMITWRQIHSVQHRGFILAEEKKEEVFSFQRETVSKYPKDALYFQRRCQHGLLGVMQNVFIK